jgi:hypothetical protein
VDIEHDKENAMKTNGKPTRTIRGNRYTDYDKMDLANLARRGPPCGMRPSGSWSTTTTPGLRRPGRILNLAGMAPDIIQAILQGREPSGLSLQTLTRDLPVQWGPQRTALGLSG